MKKHVILLFMALSGLLGSAPADSAPGIDIAAGVGILHLNPAGSLTIDEVSFLPRHWSLDKPYLSAATQPYGWVSVESILPAVPNWRADFWRFRQDGFYPAVADSGDVASTFSVSNTSLTAYYSPVNNWLKLDIGLNLRRLRVRMPLDQTENDQPLFRPQLTTTIPSVYGQLSFELPASGVRAGMSYAGLSLGGNDLVELDARLSWSGETFGLELGYRRFELNVADGPFAFDVQLDGPYLGLTGRL